MFDSRIAVGVKNSNTKLSIAQNFVSSNFLESHMKDVLRLEGKQDFAAKKEKHGSRRIYNGQIRKIPIYAKLEFSLRHYRNLGTSWLSSPLLINYCLWIWVISEMLQPALTRHFPP